MGKMEAENRGIDERVYQHIITIAQQIPALLSMGISVIYLDKGKAGMSMCIQKKFANARGIIHGGILAALADSAMGHAIATLGIRGVTVDLNINYCAPVGKDVTKLIRADGYVLHAGKTLVVAEAALYNEDEKIIAKSRGTFFITPDQIVDNRYEQGI